MMFIGLNVSLSNLNHNYYAIPNPITQQVLPVVASMVNGLIFVLLASAGFHFQERLSAVSSNPTRVCVCINEAPNCNVTLYNVTAYPGETFQIPIVAVGQRVGTVPFTVHSSFISVTSSSPPQMKPLQRTQHVRKSCTRLFYTIASSQQIEANMILTVEKLDKQIIEYIFQYPDKSQLPLVLKDLHLYISD